MRKIISLSVLLVLSFSSLAANNQLVLTGVVEQGGLIIGKSLPDSKVELNGKELKVSSQGHFAFGFGRDEVKEHKLIVQYPNGVIETKTLTPKQREYNIQRIEGIARKIMNPDQKAIERSRKDNQQIGQARAISDNRIDFAKGFAAPIDGTITGVYGSQRVYNGVPKRPHFGLDYAGKIGDPVKAPASGKVTLWVKDMFYSGGTMIIDHGHGVTSTFLHLSDSYVKVGDYVEQGQLVAAVGKSGRATGPHLDWRVNWFNVRLDPALALKVQKTAN